ncbi:MAG: potassium-transporting ATPase subunit KdpC [Spirochaetia bacterium]|jgi:K+-transporting ATPase ATPase C chain
MKPVRTAIIVTIFWTVAVGGMYPLLMYGVGAVFFPAQAHGSLIMKDGKVAGSALIGQDFSSDVYFHPRPSSIKYDASNSGASNWGWTSSDLKKAFTQNKSDWQKANGNSEPPQDMVMASGSGLDPHVSPQGAELQAPRVAAARHLSSDDAAKLLTLVRSFEEAPQLGFLGEPRVNILRLNIALDRQFPGK